VLASPKGEPILFVGRQVGCPILTTFLGDEWRAAAGTVIGMFLVFGMRTGIREGGVVDEGGF